MAGIISDQTDAAIIIPDAKPKNTVFIFSEMSFLKNHTTELPSVVARKITKNPKTVITVVFIQASFKADSDRCFPNNAQNAATA